MRRPAASGRPSPGGLVGAAAVRGLAPLALDDPADLRAAFDAVREHPTVVAADVWATTPAQRADLSAARAALVRRSVVSPLRA